MRYAATLSRPPSQAGARAAWPRVGSHDVRPLQPCLAWHGGPDCRCHGGCVVLELRWCTKWCTEGRNFSRPSTLPLRLSCIAGVFEAEEEGFEPSIPRLEVLRSGMSSLFASVQKLLQVGVFFPVFLSQVFVVVHVGWCQRWCQWCQLRCDQHG